MKKSYYYNYNFVSPESIYAEVKEELKSYFQTGILDDILFPRYTEDCLKILGRSSYKIKETILNIEDYNCELPEGFEAAREVWMVTPHELSYKMPGALYEQSTYKVDSHREHQSRCDNICAPDEIKVTYKTTGKVIQKFNCHYLLRPGNVNAGENCIIGSPNLYSESLESFDIRGNKIFTNFAKGVIYLVYYVTEYDTNDYQLVPDNIRIKNYLKASLKAMCFETIYNNVTDESFKQVESKFVFYQRMADEKRVEAQMEVKRQTIDQSIRSTLAAKHRFNKYKIS